MEGGHSFSLHLILAENPVVDTGDVHVREAKTFRPHAHDQLNLVSNCMIMSDSQTQFARGGGGWLTNDLISSSRLRPRTALTTDGRQSITSCGCFSVLACSIRSTASQYKYATGPQALSYDCIQGKGEIIFRPFSGSLNCLRKFRMSCLPRNCNESNTCG